MTSKAFANHRHDVSHGRVGRVKGQTDDHINVRIRCGVINKTLIDGTNPSTAETFAPSDWNNSEIAGPIIARLSDKHVLVFQPIAHVQLFFWCVCYFFSSTARQMLAGIQVARCPGL